MMAEEAQVAAGVVRRRVSPMSIIIGSLAAFAFTAAGFLSGWLPTGGEIEGRVVALTEISAFLIIGSVALSRMRIATTGRAAAQANFRTTRLILDTVAASDALDVAVKAVLSHARSHTKSELAALILLGSKSGAAEIATMVGSDFRTDNVRLDHRGAAPYHRVLAEGRPITVNGSSRIAAPDLPQYYPPINNFLGVPVRINNEVGGELLVANKRSSFGADDEACLAILAGFVGPLVVNHRLMFEVRQGYTGAVEALVKAIEAKDPLSRGHSERVAIYAVAIAREMGFGPTQLEDIRIGAMLHDVGKIGLPQSIIEKQGELTEEEWVAIRDHARIGAQILDPFNTSKEVLAMVYHHHERYDGRGYPAGLKGNDIPLAVRILRVADSYESFLAGRAHRAPMTRSQAVQELKARSGKDFDPAVVSALLRVLARDWRPTAEERLARMSEGAPANRVT
ncbi:MAG: HD domain-containing phosphohydrolase [Chloroflexota bacterium]